MFNRRVVITGIGIISPLGNDLETFWKNAVTGKSGVSTITHFDPAGFECRIAAESKDFEASKFFKNPKDVRRTDRYTQMAMAASRLALDMSGLDLGKIDHDRFGVVVGSGIGGLKSLSDNHTNLIQKGPNRISPFMIPMMISNMASGLISMEYGLRGPNISITSACATANHNIGEAWRMIKFGDADIFLAGGSEAAITPIGIGGFSSMKALSTRNDAPEKASRPFDKDRDGFVMGEGAGIVVIEELEHAKRRGAEILCELTGYGLSADAYHITSPSPDGDGAARCMAMALKHAGINPERIDYINAHGTSTDIGDVCETRAIKRLLGDAARNVAISSTKSMTGHLLGAAGGVELAACVMAIREGLIPPTINLDNPDPECDLDYTPHVARERKVDAALSNSFGFGGHNSTVVVQRFNG